MNKCILTGNLTKEPEIKFTAKGTAVATFTLAVSTGFGDNKETSFIPVVVWNKAAENAADHLVKGSKVLVQGRINTRSYDAKDGTKRYVTEVIADNFGGVEFLDRLGNNKNGQEQTSGNNNFDDAEEIPGDSIPF